MSAVSRGSTTSETEIEVLWSALTTSTETGGATVTSYHLQWDSGTNGGTWSDLIGLTSNYLLTTFTVTSSLTAGTTYKFRIRAKNAYGYGSYSSETSIKASDKPETMDTVTTAI